MGFTGLFRQSGLSRNTRGNTFITICRSGRKHSFSGIVSWKWQGYLSPVHPMGLQR